MTSPILSEIDANILTITFNRPDRKNAINQEMYALINAALKTAATDPKVRCVVFTGTGDMYTAGNDVAEFAATTEDTDWADSPVARFIDLISTYPKPLIAAVNGTAIGIGVSSLLHFDLVYVAENATLLMPFTKLALCPEAGSSLLLPLVVGYRKASEMLLLSEPIKGRQAVEFGIANAAVPAERVLELAQSKAQAITALAPGSIQATKRLLRAGLKTQVETIIADEWTTLTARAKSPEMKEAVTAFFEKRKPDFSQF